MFFPNFCPSFTPAASPSGVTYVGHYESVASDTSWTFTDINVGTGDYVILAFHVMGTTISQATIGAGDPFGTVVENDASDTGIAIQTHPGTSTATVVIEGAGSGTACGLAVWAVTGTYSLSFFHKTTGAYSLSVSNGFIIGYAVNGTNAATAFTGITERFDEALSTRSHVGGDYTTASEDVSIDTTATQAAVYQVFEA